MKIEYLNKQHKMGLAKIKKLMLRDYQALLKQKTRAGDLKGANAVQAKIDALKVEKKTSELEDGFDGVPKTQENKKLNLSADYKNIGWKFASIKLNETAYTNRPYKFIKFPDEMKGAVFIKKDVQSANMWLPSKSVSFPVNTTVFVAILIETSKGVKVRKRKWKELGEMKITHHNKIDTFKVFSRVLNSEWKEKTLFTSSSYLFGFKLK